ncbi:hypothetical protein K470DRAFT_271802 [Piedraia hortae CBS 480.64]|uniref:CSN8/PSMD8/EIF3K domain-containing protein n=1 Tax=Piedraia hortae CBS 480.64 TaxID=1314780 RepID=A0A6A7BW83_9PEZI|nr:hypothetical protein K470DRAFT_271802 [Piedraia hortae CBS 480.64]
MRTPTAEVFLEECLYHRGLDTEFIDSPNLVSVLTSYFLHIYYANASLYARACYYLNEGITLAETMDLHTTAQANVWAKQAYGLLSISERAFALLRGRPQLHFRTEDMLCSNVDLEAYMAILVKPLVVNAMA